MLRQEHRNGQVRKEPWRAHRPVGGLREHPSDSSPGPSAKPCSTDLGSSGSSGQTCGAWVAEPGAYSRSGRRWPGRPLQVYRMPYYEACVRDACLCDKGGDCECLCDAVAAYAKACLDRGVCVDWRAPDFCRECPPTPVALSPAGPCPAPP